MTDMSLRPWRHLVALALAWGTTVAAMSPVGEVISTQVQSEGVKAALVFNFAKFTEWPALSPGAPLSTCVAGNDVLATVLSEIVSGKDIEGHPVDVKVVGTNADWSACQIVFVSDSDRRRATRALQNVAKHPVLTVSDGEGFASSGGIIELYIDKGKMAFAINPNAAQQAGLRLRSQLLEMARIVRSGSVSE